MGGTTFGYWIMFNVGVLSLILIDLGVFQRDPKPMTFRRSLYWSLFWFALATGFAGALVQWKGGEAATQFMTAYLLEKSLSVDNLFVFVLVFAAFRIPRELQRRILTLGILGALLMRAVCIGVGAALLHQFHWLSYVFAVLILGTGLKLVIWPDGSDSESTPSRMTQFMYKWIPSTGLSGEKFVVFREGKLLATPLLLALLAIEASDVLFALDSIPASFTVSSDAFVIYTANVFAVLGLRALYFLLEDLLDRFLTLKTGIAAVLVFVGAKMLAADVYPISGAASLLVVVSILGCSVLWSWVFSARDRSGETVGPGHLSIFRDPGPGGTLARTLLPTAALMPLLLGGLHVIGLKADLFEAVEGAALLCMAMTTVFTVMVWRSARKLHSLHQKLLEAQLQLLEARKLQAIGSLAGGASHFYNNLMTVVLGYSRMILDELGPNHPLADRVHVIADAAQRTVDLTVQLKAFAQLERPRLNPVDLAEFTRSIVWELEHVLGPRVEVRIDVREQPGLVTADAVRLRGVLMTLAENSRDAMPTGGTFSIELGGLEESHNRRWREARIQSGAYAQLKVRDTGKGMDLQTQERIFEPFFTTKGLAESSGLGLASAHGILIQMGGDILVESAPGLGATFIIALPLAVQASRIGSPVQIRSPIQKRDMTG